MENSIITKYAEFNNTANGIFFTLYNEFLVKARSFERTGNENFFQLHKAQYTATVKQQLEHSAEILIENCENASVKEKLRFGLRGRIEFYVKEFMRKTEFV